MDEKQDTPQTEQTDEVPAVNLTKEQHRMAVELMTRTFLAQLAGAPGPLVMDVLITALMTAADMLKIPPQHLRTTVWNIISDAYGIPKTGTPATAPGLSDNNLMALLKALGRQPEDAGEKPQRTIGFHGPENRAK
jgi:hypothetical protein